MLREVEEIMTYRELLASAEQIPKGDAVAAKEWYQSEEDCLGLGLITFEMREALLQTLVEFQK